MSIGTIDEQRDQLDTLQRQSPSLRRLVPEYLAYAYPRAKRAAAHETGLPRAHFPEHCPFRAEQTLDPEFWPNDQLGSFVGRSEGQSPTPRQL